jgi:hypothetical protein
MCGYLLLAHERDNLSQRLQAADSIVVALLVNVVVLDNPRHKALHDPVNLKLFS